MSNKIVIHEAFNTSKEELYYSWLNSEKHTLMTGGLAECSNKSGETFTAWDGYIQGQNLHLENDISITQTWRTSEFNEDDDDSVLKIEFKDYEKGCIITITHSNLPKGTSEKYRDGWIEHYFKPMHLFFGE